MRPAYSIYGLMAALMVLPGAAIAAEDYQCFGLRDYELPNIRILSADSVDAAPFELPASGPFPPQPPADLPTHCRVKATIWPAINIEIWLPLAENWNRRLQAIGGFGLAGNINHRMMVPALQGGYVTVSTDTGHTDDNTDWMQDPQRLRDYGYRAVHEMTLLTKGVIRSYYGRRENYAYFNGCSTGGRQALIEAQRYPGDYDGLVGGAPVHEFVADHVAQLWVTLQAKPASGATLLDKEILAAVNKAVLAQCDAIDGVADGVLEDPRQCDFKPASMACTNSSGSQCLSPAQVTAMEKIYAGPMHPRTGARLGFGLMPGGESAAGPVGGWSLVTSEGDFTKPYDVPVTFFGLTVLDKPDWNWRSFDFDRDVAFAYRRTGAMLEATDPNLDEFRAGGGKMILYHGWYDPFLPPESTVAYYESVIDNLPMAATGMEAFETADFLRLFMVPGMAHCRGGPGPNDFDMMSAIEDWVEQDVAPRRIIARRITDGQVTRTRPLCPYPQTANYTGAGSTGEAENFVCE